MNGWVGGEGAVGERQTYDRNRIELYSHLTVFMLSMG